MKLYKLTDAKDQTRGATQWGEGVTHTASGEGELCGPGWVHAYTDPLLAVLLNPIHGAFDGDTLHLWECEGEVGATDHGLKVGCTSLTTVRRMDVPTVTRAQRVRFGILCTKRVCMDPVWNAWADDWLSGIDRTAARASAASAAARAAAEAGAAAWAAVAWAEAEWAEAEAVSASAEAERPFDLGGLAREAASYED